MDEAKTDLEDAEVATVMAINEMTKALMDRATAEGDEPDVKEGDRQG